MTLSPTSDIVLDVVRGLVQQGSPQGWEIYRGYETEQDHGDSQYGIVYIASSEHVGGEDLADGSMRRTGLAMVTADWFNEGALTAAQTFRAWSMSERGRDVMRRANVCVMSVSPVLNLTERVAGRYQTRAQSVVSIAYTELLTDAIPRTSAVDLDIHTGNRTQRVTITEG